MSSEDYVKMFFFLRQDLNIAGKEKYPLNKRKRRCAFRQKDGSLTEYSEADEIPFVSSDNDRVFPLETLTLDSFNEDSDNSLDYVEIHYGPNSDEVSRNLHATALTVGMAIYFRNGAFRPETEEGRKTIAHELTHVKQNKEDILEGQKSLEELEKDAEESERIAENKRDDFKTISLRGREYKVSKSQYEYIMREIKQNVEHVLEYNTLNFREEEYLKLLMVYRDMEKGKEFLWQN